MTQPIVFNGIQIDGYTILPSASKHYGERAEEIFGYIYQTLDGQNRTLNERGAHQIASHVADPNVPHFKVNKAEEYRDTCFVVDANRLTFFHGCIRRENEYQSKFTDEMKIRT